MNDIKGYTYATRLFAQPAQAALKASSESYALSGRDKIAIC